MSEAKIIHKVLVGSKLHGLDTPSSDTDYRGIHISSLRDVLSPFKKIKTTSWIESRVDDTSYELADFCKSATFGNATILEVFFSNKVIETTPTAEHMRENWVKFFNTARLTIIIVRILVVFELREHTIP